jgi:GTPase SAR1 family protein
MTLTPLCSASAYEDPSDLPVIIAYAHTGQVDSPDSLENVETKWVGEIAENCPNVKLVLVALKCDLRKRDDDDEEAQPEKPMIQYDEGLKVAEKIKALRYLGMLLVNSRMSKDD